MTPYRFRPAALRAAQDWRLDSSVLTQGARRFDLHNTKAVSVTTSKYYGVISRSLTLTSADDSVTVAVALPPSAVADHTAWTDLAATIAARLETLHPDLPVTLGEGKALAWTWFIVGLTCLIFTAGIALAATLTGISGDRMAAAAVPMLLMLVVGISCLNRPLPWSPPLTLPLNLLAPTLRATAPGP